MDLVVAYDVNTEDRAGRRRLRRIAKTCEAFGQRVQLSVFECRVNQAQLEDFESRLLSIMNKDTDSLRIYVLTGGREQNVRVYGVDHYVDFDEPLIL